MNNKVAQLFNSVFNRKKIQKEQLVEQAEKAKENGNVKKAEAIINSISQTSQTNAFSEMGYTTEEGSTILATGMQSIAAAEEPVLNYNEMTLVELKSIAKDKGIKGYYTMKKAELIEVLEDK